MNLKCSKVHPSRKLRVKIIKTFAPGGVFVRSEVWSSDGHLIVANELVSAAWAVTVSHEFHGSKWNGNTLQILDRSGVLTAEVECGDYLAP